VAGDEGEQVPLDSMDQAAMDQVHQEQVATAALSRMPLIGNVLAPQQFAEHAQEIADIQGRANKKAELAHAMTAGTTMRVDPAEVDALAKFFEDEAQGLEDRAFDVQELGAVEPPGSDPVSTKAAPVYGQVGAGSDRAYFENYMMLARVFRDTAANLRASAQQTRTDEQNAESNFRGGDLA
jgi:hypothetical protein